MLVLLIMFFASIKLESASANSNGDIFVGKSKNNDLIYNINSSNWRENEFFLEIYDNVNNIFEDLGSIEYRIADMKAAEQLKLFCEKSGNTINPQYYYDITVSFEKEHRVEAMYKMLEAYATVSDDIKNIFNSYMLSYAPYAEDSELLEKVNEKTLNYNEINLTTYNSLSDYNKSAAADWAYSNYNSYNSSFPDLSSLGGDCANFVSQCMHVGGGMKMTDDWYCYRKNTTYPKPKNASELNYSWTLADPSPWISAKKFKDFWSSSGRSTTYTYNLSDYKNGNTDAYSRPIHRGDAISLLSKVAWWYEAKHTMIVVGYDSSNKDYIYAAHTNPIKDGRVKKVGNYDGVIFYSFK